MNVHITVLRLIKCFHFSFFMYRALFENSKNSKLALSLIISFIMFWHGSRILKQSLNREASDSEPPLGTLCRPLNNFIFLKVIQNCPFRSKLNFFFSSPPPYTLYLYTMKCYIFTDARFQKPKSTRLVNKMESKCSHPARNRGALLNLLPHTFSVRIQLFSVQYKVQYVSKRLHKNLKLNFMR